MTPIPSVAHRLEVSSEGVATRRRVDESDHDGQIEIVFLEGYPHRRTDHDVVRAERGDRYHTRRPSRRADGRDRHLDTTAPFGVVGRDDGCTRESHGLTVLSTG